MSGIEGELCTTDKELRRAASKRSKSYREKIVPHDQLDSHLGNGWEIVPGREGGVKIKIRKQKPSDELFEDRVWMIFYRLGFSYMNKERQPKLKFKVFSKKIDVLAKDDENVFVVECKSSKYDEPINARSVLQEYVGNYEDIKKAIESEWSPHCGRINILVAIESQKKRDIDVLYIREKGRRKNVYLWSASELMYIERLIAQVGHAAKYQLYSIIFSKKRQRRWCEEFPAIRGRIAGHRFYTFLISAKRFIRYAYVHHRDLTEIADASQVYQRMLRNTKLREIANFIDVEDGYFPNSIIVNFTMPLQWERKRKFDDAVEMGVLTLPQYYGCAWVIDGQHRLYGVARAHDDVLVPVLAFETMDALDQANLFVEINEKQTSVPKNLLWDLYSDIYRDTTDLKQKRQFQVAETAKRLESSGPLSGTIDIPSVPKTRSVKLSLTTVCSTIEKYSPWKQLQHHKDESMTPDNAARLINSYYNVLKRLWPEDWSKGNDGVLLSNNGFGVFTMLLNDIVNHIVFKDAVRLLQQQRSKDFEREIESKYLAPVVDWLKSDPPLCQRIKRANSRGLQNACTADLDYVIATMLDGYSAPRQESFPTESASEKVFDPQSIGEKARMAEKLLRNFVLEKLKTHYGERRWWKQAIPGGIKKNCDGLWSTEVSRKPWLRKEKQQNDKKFDFLGLGELKDVVIYGSNWTDVFADVFINRPEFEKKITQIKVFRDPATHGRSPENQDIFDGAAGLAYLSNCLTEPTLAPNPRVMR